ncbi:hypothetical protein Dsin_009701 [Dipteronia sinensis]|uniref:DNL-type domain-containing protein n=1 Tax=Dipteronia sinensis TaxID=43782 RepID=A0AAE0AR44_9ROSI|nr:hypothetical protein Dsin_009701 [Dipteronia sinensis]
MAATAAAAASFFRPTSSTSTPTAFKPVCPNSFKPITVRNKLNPTRLTISNFKTPAPKPAYRVLAVSGSTPEPESNHSNKDATFELKLPRRSLLVQFTCNDCGERTQRLINRLAYERGLVYVQCAGCLKHHKLVDNLGLVVEFDLREEISLESNIDQV